MAEEIMMALVK